MDEHPVDELIRCMVEANPPLIWIRGRGDWY